MKPLIKSRRADMPSLSLLIGLIISVFILGSIFYVLYQIGAADQNDTLKHFNNLAKKIEEWESTNGELEGSMPYFIDKYHAVVGFAKEQGYVDTGNVEAIYTGLEGFSDIEVELDCYSVSRIERPKEGCKEGESCLCLCEMRDEIIDCKKPNVICRSFDKAELVGGLGCTKAALIPGLVPGLVAKQGYAERGVAVVKYLKKGDVVSIDNQEAMLLEDLDKLTEEGKKAIDSFQSFLKDYLSCKSKAKANCGCAKFAIKEMPEGYSIRLSKIEESNDAVAILLFKEQKLHAVKINNLEMCSYEYNPSRDRFGLSKQENFQLQGDSFKDYLAGSNVRLFKGAGNDLCFVRKNSRGSFDEFETSYDSC